MSGRSFRRRPKGAPDNWPISLADLMTTLMCFFVLILAIATIDQKKFAVVSENLADSLGARPQAAPPPPPPPPSGVRMEAAPPPPQSLFALQADLAKVTGRKEEAVEVKLKPDAVTVDLKGAIFFQLGQAELTQKAQEILGRLAGPLKSSGHALTVEGHTDNLPIHSPLFPSNWELSAARAAAVARHLISQGFPAEKMRVVGLADTRPVAPNTGPDGKDIPENQARNRRVTLLVTTGEGR